MITAVWLPLFIGYALTASLIAYSDIRYKKVHDLMWIPAIGGALLFYAGAPEIILRETLTLTFLIMTTTFLVSKFAFKQIGGADRIAIAVFAFWPLLFLYSLIPSVFLTLALYAFRRKAAIPLAGLMSLCALPMLVVLGL